MTRRLHLNVNTLHSGFLPSAWRPAGSNPRAFVDGVVPLLQRRGIFRTGYEGNTLRQHLGLARPPGRGGGHAAA
jgi:hypothetical protein